MFCCLTLWGAFFSTDITAKVLESALPHGPPKQVWSRRTALKYLSQLQLPTGMVKATWQLSAKGLCQNPAGCTVSMSWTAPDSFLRLRFLATIPSSDLRSSQFPFIPALMCYESSQHNTLNKITFSQTQFNDSCMWHLHLESLQFMSTSKSAKVQSMQMIPSLFRRSCSCWYCFLAVVSY